MNFRWLTGQNNNQRTNVLIPSALLLALAGCGGGGGDDNPVTLTPGSTSGIVADGYLSGAKVCLDINQNKICNAGEPSATTGTGGTYTLDVTDATLLNQYPIFVEVPAEAIDSDTGQAVGKKFVLSAPIGKSAFISPLTTMVQNQIEANPNMTVDAAEAALISSMGKDPAAVSLFTNYVAAKADSTNAAASDYATLHNIAQVTARTLANNIETIEAAITNGSVNLTIDEAFDALIQIVVEEVVTQLAAITAEVEAAEAASADGSIDADAVTTTSNVAVDTTTVETKVAVVEATNSAANTTLEQQLADGFNWVWGEINSDWQEIEYGTITVASGVVTENQYTYNFTSSTFEPLTSSPDVYLGNNGWIPSTAGDDLSNCTVAFNGNGSGTFTCDVETFTVSSQVVDAASLNISAYLDGSDNGGFSSAVDSTAVFSTGAKAYIMSITYDAASYTLDDTPLITQPASLADLLSSSAWVDDGSSEPKTVWAGFKRSPEGCIEPAYSPSSSDTPCTLSQGMIVELVGSGVSGTANFYLTDYVNRNNATGFHSVNKVATSTWSIQTVSGAAILSYETPVSVATTYAYLNEDSDNDAQRIFSVYNNAVYEGSYTPAGTSDSGGPAFNSTAINDVINSIIATGSGSGSLLACTTESGWDDTANGGLGAPITAYSFADFEAAIADCGSVQSFTRADIAGNAFDNDGEITTFNDTGTAATAADPETGSFANGVDPAISFEWYVENATCTDCTHSYLVLYTDSSIDSSHPVDFQFRETSALTAQSGDTFSFIHYAEASNYSDMIRSTGSDGELWSGTSILVP